MWVAPTNRPFFWAIVVLGFGAGVLVALEPVGFLIVAACTGTVAVAAHYNCVAAVLLLASAPFLRPNIFGEDYGLLGLGLVLTAAFLSLVDMISRRRLSDWEVGRIWLVPSFLGVAYVWLFVVQAVSGTDLRARVVMQGGVVTFLIVSAAVVVVSERRSAAIVAKGFVVLVVVCSLSYAVSLVAWLVVGVGSVELGSIAVSGRNELQPVYVPFTTTVSSLSPFGQPIPRFTGIGREPGWMAMYCVMCFFLAPRIGLSSPWWRVILLVGFAGCMSTGAFGVFVIFAVLDQMIKSRRDVWSTGGALLRYSMGATLMVGAIYLAAFAPVLGFTAKSQINEESAVARSEATAAGWQALWNSPLGGDFSRQAGGLNLVAAISTVGLPFVLLVLLALCSPAFLRGVDRKEVLPALILPATLATSQPAQDSAWVFAAAVICYAAVMAKNSNSPDDWHRSSGRPPHLLEAVSGRDGGSRRGPPQVKS